MFGKFLLADSEEPRGVVEVLLSGSVLVCALGTDQNHQESLNQEGLFYIIASTKGSSTVGDISTIYHILTVNNKLRFTWRFNPTINQDDKKFLKDACLSFVASFCLFVF